MELQGCQVLDRLPVVPEAVAVVHELGQVIELTRPVRISAVVMSRAVL